MKLDAHWLKETHKDIDSEELKSLASHALIFGAAGEYATLKAELERRRETHETNG
jgi:hypothetical protein